MNLKSILEKSKKYPPKIVVKKAVHKGFTLTQDYLRYINDIIFEIGLSDDELNKKILMEKIEETYSNLSLLPVLCKEAKDKIIKEADKSKNHIFNLLGSGDVKEDYKLNAKGLEGYRYDMKLSKKEYSSIKEKVQSELEKVFQKSIEYEPMDWQVDFKSGYRWSEKTYYKFIKYGHKLGADVKVPWELSRMQHLIQLALAYRSTKKEEYAKEIIKQTIDWILTNRDKFGVNWRCTMDVAIRVTNWVITINLIEDYINNLPSEGKECFYKIFYKSLYQHGDFIIRNLEWSEDLISNHYLSDIAGLLVLAIFTENIFKEAGEWKKIAIKELKKEMLKQVYSDGTNFEASTCYHRLVVELFFYSTFFVVQNEKYKVENEKKDLLSSEDDYKTIAEDILGKDYIDRLYKMFDAILHLLKPNGRMPQIGDNDNGQFLKLYPREVLDMRYLLALGAVFFKESKWKIKEFFKSDEDIAEVLILYGKKGVQNWNSLEWNSLKDVKSKAFSDSGWYVMRNNKDYCIISCGPNGQNGKGGHCHNDKLSFELCIDGEDIIVDPGTYVYTPLPEWRNKFRSTAYHNTVMIDKEEQNRFSENNLFFMKNDNVIKIDKWKIFKEYDILEVAYRKHNGIKDSNNHCRQFIFNKKERKLEIVDTFKGEGEHRLEWGFVLSPDFKRDLKIQSDSPKFKKIQWQKESSFYSPEYGVIKRTDKLTTIIESKIPFNINICVIKSKGEI